MDIFAGCGGLSEGFQQARAAVCKWAIEYEHPAAEAFKLNHPEAHVMCDNCNVILAAAMHKAGLQDLCKASPEARPKLFKVACMPAGLVMLCLCFSTQALLSIAVTFGMCTCKFACIQNALQTFLAMKS